MTRGAGWRSAIQRNPGALAFEVDAGRARIELHVAVAEAVREATGLVLPDEHRILHRLPGGAQRPASQPQADPQGQGRVDGAGDEEVPA